MNIRKLIESKLLDEDYSSSDNLGEFAVGDLVVSHHLPWVSRVTKVAEVFGSMRYTISNLITDEIAVVPGTDLEKFNPDLLLKLQSEINKK